VQLNELEREVQLLESHRNRMQNEAASLD